MTISCQCTFNYKKGIINGGVAQTYHNLFVLLPTPSPSSYSPIFYHPTRSAKWTSFYVLYSGGCKCKSLWPVSLRSGCYADITKFCVNSTLTVENQRDRNSVSLQTTYFEYITGITAEYEIGELE